MTTPIKRLYRKARLLLKTKLISYDMLGDLLFGQQHIGTQSFFLSRLGQYHTVELRDFPHYRFLLDHLDNPFSDHDYMHYLECSWAYYFKENNTFDSRKRQIVAFLKLYKDIENKRDLGERAIEKPIVVCRRPDGKTIIVDGNHRAAIALALRLNVRALEIPVSEYLSTVVDVPEEFFGTGRLNRPYQSITYKGKLLVKGRRLDIHDRMQMILAEDLEGRTVLDLGCNIGMNCYISAERGAIKAVGVERNPAIASAAVRLNAYFAAPCHFIVHDLNEDLNIGRFDTILCFSLIGHLNSTNSIVNTIKQSIGNVLYFEGHANTSQRDYDYLLNENIFSKIDLIGYARDEFLKKTATRPVFRCML